MKNCIFKYTQGEKLYKENEISFNNFYSNDKLFKQKSISEEPLDTPQIDKNNQIYEHKQTTQKNPIIHI